jgi:hypothetical protein
LTPGITIARGHRTRIDAPQGVKSGRPTSLWRDFWYDKNLHKIKRESSGHRWPRSRATSSSACVPIAEMLTGRHRHHKPPSRHSSGIGHSRRLPLPTAALEQLETPEVFQSKYRIAAAYIGPTPESRDEVDGPTVSVTSPRLRRRQLERKI